MADPAPTRPKVPDDWILPFPPNPVIEAYKPGVDFSLCLENLKLTPQERLEKLQDAVEFFEELRRAGEAYREGR